MAEEEVAAAQAEVDQAQAAVDEARPKAEAAQQAFQAVNEEKLAAMEGFKQRLNELAPANEEASAELEKAEGGLRVAQDKLAAAEAGEEYQEPPAQGVGE